MKFLITTALSILLLGGTATVTFATNGGNGGQGGNGGNGGNAGLNGQPGLPGCDGGTDPSSDGKFYVAGTKQQCNPSDEDRQKLK